MEKKVNFGKEVSYIQGFKENRVRYLTIVTNIHLTMSNQIKLDFHYIFGIQEKSDEEIE